MRSWRVSPRASARVKHAAARGLTVRTYAATWIVKRRERDLDWKGDEGWLKHHVLPELGELPIADVRARHLVDLFHKLRTDKERLLAPKTIYNVYACCSAMFRDASPLSRTAGQQPRRSQEFARVLGHAIAAPRAAWSPAWTASMFELCRRRASESPPLPPPPRARRQRTPRGYVSSITTRAPAALGT